MDANKRDELKRIGYKVHPVCRFCLHGRFNPGTDWGVCASKTYEHLKHSDAMRQLSIFKDGSCPAFERDEAKVALLGLFAEFLTK